MTEEKPISEQTETAEPVEQTPGSSAPSSSASEPDGIAAALSALSSAAAPVREESAFMSVPAPDAVNIAFTPAPPDPASSTQAPPPPPPPESDGAYPAPLGTPIAVNAVPAGVVPPAPVTKRKKWPWILAICIVAGMLLLGGLFSCASCTMDAAFHAIQHNERHHDYEDFFNPYTEDGLWNYYFGGMDVTFDDILDMFNVEEGQVQDGLPVAEPGAYRVGGEDGITPGLYYLAGSQNGISNFYVFHSDDDPDDALYTLAISVEFFGNYYTELDDGDVIVFRSYDRTCNMHLANGPMDVVPPYKSGCYRVGIDIPAGTYTITCDADVARETDSEAGAYVMQDLAFEEDSIVEAVYVIKGGRQTITVENGEYLELFATIATPATASTKTPLQPAGSEHIHGA